jgi:hypothetical protein
MAGKNLEAMSMEELDEYKRGLKADIAKIKEEKTAAAIVYQGKVTDWHIQQATDEVKKAAKADGRTPEEQAEFWLSQSYADPGKHIMARRFLEHRLVNSEDL